MTRKVTIFTLIAAIATSMAGFPFEAADAHDWAGAWFVAFGLSLFASSALLAVGAGRAQQDVAAVGFASVAMYGLGTTLNSSLLARGLAEASVGIQAGVWAMLALGLALIGFGGWFSPWVRTVGLISAAGHAIAATALLFGAEMPTTGAEPSDWAPMMVAISKLLFWTTLIGWIIALWKTPTRPTSGIGPHPGADTDGADHDRTIPA